jgi:hypothetical protein
VEFTVRTEHHALRWVMNLAEAQGRLARWRLRLSEFTFKVENSRGAMNHAADTMSRLPGTGALSEPIDVEIPVDLVSDPASIAKMALEPDLVDSIQEIEVLLPSEIFEHQCRDPFARHVASRLGSDPSWDYEERVSWSTTPHQAKYEYIVPRYSVHMVPFPLFSPSPRTART